MKFCGERLKRSKPTCSKRVPKIALILIGLVGILYSGVWFVFSHLLHHYADEALQALNDSGQQHVICENLRKNGYPLRIALVCDRVEWQEHSQQFTLKLGEIVAGAPIYAPSWRTLTIEAPGSFTAPDFGTIDALWQHLTLNADFDKGEPQDVILAIEDLRLKLPESVIQADFIRLQLKHAPGHQIQAPLYADLSFEALRLPLESGQNLPAISGEVKISLTPEEAAYPLAQALWPDALRGARGHVEKAALNFVSGGGVLLTGDFSFSAAGALSGKFTLTVRQATALNQNARKILAPNQAGNLESLFFALNAMPKNEKGEPTIPLQIDEGQVRAGFIPLGTLSPL